MSSEPAEQPPPSRFRAQINAIVETQIARYPFLIQMRAVLRQLQHEEGLPLLIPLLLVVFFFSYRQARKRVLELERELGR